MINVQEEKDLRNMECRSKEIISKLLNSDNTVPISENVVCDFESMLRRLLVSNAKEC